jgi:hypothetical protein
MCGRAHFPALIAVLAVAGFEIGCAADAPNDDGGPTAIKSSELVGFLQYGDEIVAAPSAAEQAFGFRANAYDRVEIALTGGRHGGKFTAVLVDEAGREVASIDEATQTLRYTMPGQAAQRVLLLRDAPANVHVRLNSTGIREPASPFDPASGAYSAPRAFAEGTHDVTVRCLDTTYANDVAVHEAETAARIALDLSTEPRVTSVDGALRLGTVDDRLDHVALRRSSASTFENTVTLESYAHDGYWGHRLQLTNAGHAAVRVEYALTVVTAGTHAVERTLSCVGVLPK